MILGDGPIGEQIRQWRINIGMTVVEAAKRADVGATVWARIEKGETPNPLYSTVMAMFRGMGAVVEAKFIPREKVFDDTEQLPMHRVRRAKPGSRLHADA